MAQSTIDDVEGIVRLCIAREAYVQVRKSYVSPLQLTSGDEDAASGRLKLRRRLGGDPPSRKEYDSMVDQLFEDSMQTMSSTSYSKSIDGAPTTIRSLKVQADVAQASTPIFVYRDVADTDGGEEFDPAIHSTIILRNSAKGILHEHKRLLQAERNSVIEASHDEKHITNAHRSSETDLALAQSSVEIGFAQHLYHSKSHDQASVFRRSIDEGYDESDSKLMDIAGLGVALPTPMAGEEGEKSFVVCTKDLLSCSTILGRSNHGSANLKDITLAITVSNVNLNAVRFAVGFIQGRVRPYIRFEAATLNFWFDVAIVAHCLGLTSIQVTILTYLSQRMLSKKPTLISHDAIVSIYLRSLDDDPLRQLLTRATLNELLNLDSKRKNPFFLADIEHDRAKFVAQTVFPNVLEDIYETFDELLSALDLRESLRTAWLEWVRCDPVTAASEEIISWLFDQYDPDQKLQRAARGHLSNHKYPLAPKNRDCAMARKDLGRAMYQRFRADADTGFTEKKVLDSMRIHGYPVDPVMPTEQHVRDILNQKFMVFKKELNKVFEAQTWDISDLVSPPFINLPSTIALQKAALVNAKLLPAQTPSMLVWPIRGRDNLQPRVMSGIVTDEKARQNFEQCVRPLTMEFLRSDFTSISDHVIDECVSTYCQKLSLPDEYQQLIRLDVLRAYDDERLQLKAQIVDGQKPVSVSVAAAATKPKLVRHSVVSRSNPAPSIRAPNVLAEKKTVPPDSLMRSQARRQESRADKRDLAKETDMVVQGSRKADLLAIARAQTASLTQERARQKAAQSRQILDDVRPMIDPLARMRTNFKDFSSYREVLPGPEPPTFPTYRYEESVVVPGRNGMLQIVSITTGAYSYFFRHVSPQLLAQGATFERTRAMALEEWSTLDMQSRQKWVIYAREQGKKLSIPGVDVENLPWSIVGIETRRFDRVQVDQLLHGADATVSSSDAPAYGKRKAQDDLVELERAPKQQLLRTNRAEDVAAVATQPQAVPSETEKIGSRSIVGAKSINFFNLARGEDGSVHNAESNDHATEKRKRSESLSSEMPPNKQQK